MMSAQGQAGHAEDRAERCDRFAALIVLLCAIAATAALRGDEFHGPPPSVPVALATINPNVAPWWELSMLPEVGDSLAKQIEQFRTRLQTRTVVFHRAADLDQIPGIGPKTIQRIARYLHFSPRENSNSDGSASTTLRSEGE